MRAKATHSETEEERENRLSKEKNTGGIQNNLSGFRFRIWIQIFLEAGSGSGYTEVGSENRRVHKTEQKKKTHS